MWLTDIITRFGKPKNEALLYRPLGVVAGDIFEARQPYGRLIWSNIVEMVTSLVNDVTLTKVAGDWQTFADFKRFFDTQGERALIRMYNEGYCVIGHNSLGFELLKTKDYTKTTDDGDVVVIGNYGDDIHIIKSANFENYGISDRQMCYPFIEYIDNTLNASNTCTARLGALVVASPAQSGSMPTASVLTKQQKDELEKGIAEDYGALRKQKQIMVLQRAMNVQVVSLVGVDAKTQERVKMAALAIADRVRVPASQIGIVDGGSTGNSLSNGGEVREGDYLRYATFERVLNRTYINLATELGLKVNYTIYNKPQR